jgi:hypothetical protein
MQKLPLALVSAAVVFAASAGASSLAAEDVALPLRQAGKWRLTTQIDEGKGPVSQALTMCIDAEMEKNTAASSASEHKSQCGRYEVKRDGDKTIVEADCAYAVDHVKSRTEMSGDFRDAFLVKIDSTTVTKIPNGKTVTRHRVITQTGERVDSACGDIKPGEAVGDDGSRVMVQ